MHLLQLTTSEKQVLHDSVVLFNLLQRQVLVVLYQEWFKVSSQKDSQADTVRIYLRQVGMTTPTLLPYVVNLTDGNGNMALHYSVSHSNFPVVKLLLDTGEKQNSSTVTANEHTESRRKEMDPFGNKRKNISVCLCCVCLLVCVCVISGLCETDNVNKAGYTPVMLAALTAAETPDDLEVAQQLLRLGDVNARSRQVIHITKLLILS